MSPIGDTGTGIAGVAFGNSHLRNVFSKASLKFSKLGAVDDNLGIHQCRRRYDKPFGLEIPQPCKVVGKCGVFGEGWHGQPVIGHR